MSATSDLCEEYASRIDALIGVFLDGSYAMAELSSQFMDQHLAAINELEASGQPFDREQFNPIMTYDGMAEDSSGGELGTELGDGSHLFSVCCSWRRREALSAAGGCIKRERGDGMRP